MACIRCYFCFFSEISCLSLEISVGGCGSLWGGTPGGGGTPLQEANGDVPLDGVAFSIDLLEWGRKF